MDYITEKIRQLEADLKELRQDVVRKEAALAAYLDAREHLPKAPEPKRARRKRNSGTRSKGLSENWQKILLHIHAVYPGHRSLAEIYQWIEGQGMEMKIDSLRTQLAQHINRGHAHRIAPGAFAVSAENLRKAGVKLPAIESKKGPGAVTPEPLNNVGPHGGGKGFASELPEGSIPSGSTDFREVGSENGDDVPF